MAQKVLWALLYRTVREERGKLPKKDDEVQ